MKPRTRTRRVLLAALSTLAIAAVASSCSDDASGRKDASAPTTSGFPAPTPASVAPSASNAATAPRYTADGGSRPPEQLNAGVDALATLPGVKGASRAGSRVQVDLAPTITAEQRDAVLRLLAGIGEVDTGTPSASPSVKVTTRAPTVTPSR